MIAANSALALFGHRHTLNVDWLLLLELLAPALLATLSGIKMTEVLSAQQLRKVFGAFVILLGLLMTASNTALIFKRSAKKKPLVAQAEARAMKT